MLEKRNYKRSLPLYGAGGQNVGSLFTGDTAKHLQTKGVQIMSGRLPFLHRRLKSQGAISHIESA